MSHRVLGLVILLVGVILLAFGINSANTVTEGAVEGVTGKYTSGTMWYLIAGVVMAVIGSFMTFRRRRG
jgi:LPXTG-motif cell wall-anchored protein